MFSFRKKKHILIYNFEVSWNVASFYPWNPSWHSAIMSNKGTASARDAACREECRHLSRRWENASHDAIYIWFTWNNYGSMGYIMLINYDKFIYLLTCGCCFAVFVMEHLGMGYPKSSTEPVSHVDLSHSTNKKNRAKPCKTLYYIQDLSKGL